MFTCFNVLEIHYFSYTDTLITVALIQDQLVKQSVCRSASVPTLASLLKPWEWSPLHSLKEWLDIFVDFFQLFMERTEISQIRLGAHPRTERSLLTKQKWNWSGRWNVQYNILSKHVDCSTGMFVCLSVRICVHSSEQHSSVSLSSTMWRWFGGVAAD